MTDDEIRDRARQLSRTAAPAETKTLSGRWEQMQAAHRRPKGPRRGLGDVPALLFAIADQLDRELRHGTDMAAQLRSLAAAVDLRVR